MKPTTEDFLIPMADIMRISNVDDIREAAKIRIRAAIDAKAAHDEECQRLADEWVLAHRDELDQKAMDYKSGWWGPVTVTGQMNIEAQAKWKRGEIWQKMRSTADSIFRDYISEQPPTA